MKKILFFSCIVFFAACKEKPAEETNATQQTSNPELPYKASYSSNFVSGDATHMQTILNIWKMYDEGRIDDIGQHMADSISITLADGTVWDNYPKDTVISMLKMHRNSFSAVQSEVHAATAMKAQDVNEDWVLVWGTEKNTSMKGVVDSVGLHEAWRINKDGKVNWILQYAQQYKK